MKITFDGPNKIININPDVTDIDVQSDLYSNWKKWSIEGSNTKYPQAFRTFGGDPTSIDGSQVAPRYFFLTHGWRVKVDGISVNFRSNLYIDEGETPFIVVNNGVVDSKNSDAQGVNGGETNIWEQLITEHHEPGSFGEIIQKLFLDAHKAANARLDT